ncbi:MAG: right-handed parallel beta-helix repeat-containing protein, partial [Cryomorphaceae bacterium]|nr:right-handed parallel beta-helix repeat-containing protein [Cryomorphaceae bacterium]
MMKVYKKVKHPLRLFNGWIIASAILILGLTSTSISAQCIRTASWGALTVSDQTTTVTNINTCIFTDEYSNITVNDPGQYEFAITGAATYLTVTDASNTVIDHGPSPLTVSIVTTGAYRLHYAEDATYASASTCRTSTAQYIGPLGGGTISVQVGFGTTISGITQYVPAYRFSAASGNRYNRAFAIYEEAELISAGLTPGATISSMSFNKDVGGTTAGNDLEMKIWIRTGTLSAPLSATPWATLTAGSTLVLDANNITFTNTDDWVEFEFDTPFNYTGGTLEVAFENELNGTSPYGTDAWKWIYDPTLSYFHCLGNVSTLSTFSTANLNTSASYTFRPNTRFEITAPTGTDLALSEFIEPLASCPGSTDVIVAILNAGSEDVDTATIGWTLNGVAQTSVTWTGNIGTGDTAHVNLGSFASVASTLYNIEAYIQNVGPGLDTNTSNDSIAMPYQPALDGNFTIDPNIAASGTNFQTFEDAVDALNTFGVCGPVVFEAVADTFNEQVILGEVAGGSATNTITFKGAGANNTVLTFAQNLSDDRYTWRFDGSSYVIIDSMSIVAQESGIYGWTMHLTNGAHDITVKNCSIVTHASSTSTFFNGVIASGTNTGYTATSGGFSNYVFDNNVFIGGYNAIRLNGLAADRVSNLQFTNNRLEDIRWAGLYITQGEDITVDGNYFIGQTGITTGGGIYLLNINGYEITNNEVYDQGQYGIYLSNCAGTSADRALVANNAVSGIGNTGTLGSSIRLLGSSHFVDIINNSCLISSGPGRTFQISVVTPNNLRLLNNTFVHTESTGYAMYINNGSIFDQIDYNNYFSPGSNFVYYGANRADLAALQAVGTPTGNDANSVEADPLYVADNFLMPLSGALSGAGTAFASVNTDITGATRATPPDIGAYEFVPVNADVALLDARLIDGECLSSNDTIEVSIVNTLGSTINFATDSIVATWDVVGPNNSNGTVVFNSGTLAEGDTATAISLGVDLSVPGIYTFNVYIDTNAINESAVNDTLSGMMHERRPVFTVSPSSVTVSNNQDSVEVSARSPFMPG